MARIGGDRKTLIPETKQVQWAVDWERAFGLTVVNLQKGNSPWAAVPEFL
jgi:hypothetical protein